VSNLERPTVVQRCGDPATAGGTLQQFAGRKVMLGESSTVLRLLPNRRRSTAGAWCFADHFGPEEVDTGRGMWVPPHPHAGLQTVTWLIAGEVRHRDSLGTEQLIRPGQLNLMTAGRGVTHSEESPVPRSARLHGVQLWLALPRASADVEPSFEHLPALPRVPVGELGVTVLVGEIAGAASPARTYSPVVGAEVVAEAGAAGVLPLVAGFEHAVLAVDGLASVDGVDLAPGTLLYAGQGRTSMAISAAVDARLIVLGGRPLGEQFIMWWNFVAHSAEEIAAARADWERGHPRFGDVHGFDGDRLAAPPLPPGRLRPRG